MISENLRNILSKLPSGVQLVAVSKFHPIPALMEAYDAGQRIFGENRPQELAAKVPQMPADVQWHFIGHLQTNKLKLVLPYVTLVQSVDSLHLLEAISAWAMANNRVIDVLLELHLGAEETKHGFTEDEILGIIGGADTPPETSFASLRPLPPSAVPTTTQACSPSQQPAGPSLLHGRGWPWVSGGVSAPLNGVRIRGLMGMATNTDDMVVVERDFERIEALYNKVRAMGLPDFDQLSIGMSGDWPLAVKHGATMVRIGTDIFGEREY
jgi:hypothetical protein